MFDIATLMSTSEHYIIRLLSLIHLASLNENMSKNGLL